MTSSKKKKRQPPKRCKEARWPCDKDCDCERIWVSQEPEKWASYMAIAEHKETGENVNQVIDRLVSRNLETLSGMRTLQLEKFHVRLQSENLRRIIEGKGNDSND